MSVENDILHAATHRYHLTEQQGKAVQEILNRYVGELEGHKTTFKNIGLNDRELVKDIDYITTLAKLFD